MFKGFLLSLLAAVLWIGSAEACHRCKRTPCTPACCVAQATAVDMCCSTTLVPVERCVPVTICCRVKCRDAKGCCYIKTIRCTKYVRRCVLVPVQTCTPTVACCPPECPPAGHGSAGKHCGFFRGHCHKRHARCGGWW